MNDKATRAALLTAKRKDKASENIADYVADLLRQGRASEVTDDLMAQADPQRLHHHYVSGNTGQPMPMDKASRMARAEQMGMTHKGYHSALRDQDRFDPTGKFMGYTGTSGISTTDNPAAASRYLDRYGDRDYKGVPFDKNVIPTLSNIGRTDVRIEPYRSSTPMGHPLPDEYTPAHEAAGFDSAQFPDAISAKGPVKHSDAKNAIRSTETVMSDPTNIRSEFARFDPRLSHLAHLSASTGGAMDFARHVEAVNRAGGQIAPSKYLPDVPRQVHAAGGRVLPKGYSLKVDPDRLGVLARFKGRNVGQLTLSRDRETGKLTAFQMAVHPDHQRKGLMSAMHDAAEDAFGPMEPDKTLTDQGFAFWKGYRPDAVSNNLRFHTDKLMGQTVKTPYGPGTVRSVGSTGMNAELENGNTGWARAADNEDVLRNVGIDPSTLKYADGGRVEDAINALPHVGQNRNGVPPEEAVASPLPHMEYPYMSMTPAKSVYAEPLRMAINKAHAEAKVEDVPMDKIVTDVGAIGKSKIRNPAEGHPFIERINGVHHLRDGNHRAAAAFLRGDRSIKALVADMDEAIKVNGRADGGRIGKAYGGGFGYVPQNFTAPQQLTVAQVARPKQQQGTSPLEALAQLAELNTKKPEETAAAPQGSPSAASEGHPPAEGVSTAAQAALDALRKGWSGAPISVISDYRDPTKNQAVGGAKGSQHLHGNAFDIDTTGWTEEQKLALATNAYNAGFRGFGFYGNNLHFDVGGQRAWGPSYHQDSIPEWAQPWTQQYIYASGGRVGKAGGGALGDNFQSWFGNSVTHTDGQPHVFYTGTSKDKDFTSFNVGRHGAWFTRDPAVASSYAEENDSQGYKQDGWNMVKTNTASRVIPAYVKAENPYMGEYTGAMTDNYKKAQSDWFDTLRAKGHDAWMPASQGGNLVVALKEPQQIKSIYNNGQFGPNQKHMNKAGGGEIDGVGNNQIGEIGNAQAAPGNGQVGPQALGLLGSGGVRGGQGVLPAPSQASGEEDLIGLPKSVKMPKLGQTITAGHDPRIRQVSRDYAQTSGIDYTPPTTYRKVDPARAKRIADAYEAMPHDPDHPLVKASYNALLNETKAQYDAMKRAGVKLEFYPDINNDPYKSNPRLAVEDIRKNNHMYVYPTDAGYGTGDAMPDLGKNPMLGDSGERWNGKPVMFNDLFRAVHDYFGHAKEGVGFRADGEENAWRQHAAMFSPLARIALATETRGQNSWLNYGPHGDKNRTAATEDTVFAPQKLGVLPIWAHHEGAEDFIKPQERAQMEAIYRQYSKPVNKALELTRRFTKDGAAATMALKSKGN